MGRSAREKDFCLKEGKTFQNSELCKSGKAWGVWSASTLNGIVREGICSLGSGGHCWFLKCHLTLRLYKLHSCVTGLMDYWSSIPMMKRQHSIADMALD